MVQKTVFQFFAKIKEMWLNVGAIDFSAIIIRNYGKTNTKSIQRISGRFSLIQCTAGSQYRHPRLL